MPDDSVPVSRRQLLATTAALAGAAGVTLMPQPAAAIPVAETASVSVADYIAMRLRQAGCDTLFGIPGATCDPFFDAALQAKLSIIVTASDLEAGYAADGYARCKGLGAVSVTYGVGMLSLANAIAGAYVERSPVVVINGGPSLVDIARLKEDGSLFSHSIGEVRLAGAGGDEDLLADLRVFRAITAHAVRVTTRDRAPRAIDAALKVAIAQKRPVYIEIAKDLWSKKVAAPAGRLDAPGDGGATEAALAGKIIAKLRAARRPALLIGIEVARYGLGERATAVVQKLGIPWSTTLLAKSVVAEDTVGFLGTYDGPRAPKSVVAAIREADVLLALGCVPGRQYRELYQSPPETLIRIADGVARVGRARRANVDIGRLLSALEAQSWSPDPAHLAAAQLRGTAPLPPRRPGAPPDQADAAGDTGLTYDELMGPLAGFIDPSFTVITDTSVSMHPAADLLITRRGGFLCNAVWQSIGYSVGAAIGVGVAERERAASRRPPRPLVLCGDGGFQMSVQALSTLAHHNIPAIVLVLDNGLYAIEQWTVEATRGIAASDKRSFFRSTDVKAVPYLGLPRWHYAALAKAMGFARADQVDAAADLLPALNRAKAADGPHLIAVRMKQRSLPAELSGS
ncbi:thiamine pyrophosphate-binding protein [Chelatococcus reniformis]|uniref:Thiamine pyrophosphate-binding protein n=1 Tax=Chelatococcus reniformis TaxID=1494448 RepID=A0A916XE19_9HYPH|nr:thiamine pyrophosphate-binding protein [Chelatococcus reniformis]GGC64848.1 hypothetical protein GCM10010994_24310 [Chelatococcus reniformis]